MKYVIFDFDGTIADTYGLLVDIFNKNLAKKYGMHKIENPKSLKDTDLKEIIKISGLSFFKIFSLIKEGRKIFDRKVDKIKLFPDIKNTIKKLSKKHKLGILSSNSVKNIKYVLKKEKLIDYFEFVESKRALFGKHSALKKILKKHKIKNDEAIYIGDEVRDIMASHKTKIKIISVVWGYNVKKILKKHKPDFIATKPKEILRILNLKKLK